MPFVLDCSVAMSWIFQDEATDATDTIRDRLIDDVAHVPSLWSIEVANVLAVATRRGRIAESDWTVIQYALSRLPIETDGKTHEYALSNALPLAHRHGISVYDAVYLELAIRLKTPLATFDKQLRIACEAEGIEIL